MTDALVDRVVSVVAHQTSGPQPDRVPWHVVMTVLVSHVGEDVDAVWDAAEAAVEEGRLEYDSDEQVFWRPA